MSACAAPPLDECSVNRKNKGNYTPKLQLRLYLVRLTRCRRKGSRVIIACCGKTIANQVIGSEEGNPRLARARSSCAHLLNNITGGARFLACSGQSMVFLFFATTMSNRQDTFGGSGLVIHSTGATAAYSSVSIRWFLLPCLHNSMNKESHHPSFWYQFSPMQLG